MNNDINDAKTLDRELEEVLDNLDVTDPVSDGQKAASNPVPSPQGQQELKIASVIQMHKLAGTTGRRGPGRPRKPDPETTKAIADYHAQMAREQVEFVDRDPIVRATDSPKESAEMLRLVRQRLARIQASLDFRRIEDEKLGGKEAAQILSRQTAVLREIAQIELKIKEMGAQTLDLRGEPMQKVFALLIGRIQKVASETLPKAQFDLFFNRLGTALEDWEDEADSVIR
jgi:hypothetical protein